MGHERAPVSQEPLPPSPPSPVHTAVFGIRLQAPTLGPPWSSHPPLFLSLCMTDGQMTSTHVPLLSIQLFLSVSQSSDIPLSWLTRLGISPPSPFLAASSTSQTRAHLVPSSAFSCLSLSFYFPISLSVFLVMYLPTNTFCLPIRPRAHMVWANPSQM